MMILSASVVTGFGVEYPHTVIISGIMTSAPPTVFIAAYNGVLSAIGTPY